MTQATELDSDKQFDDAFEAAAAAAEKNTQAPANKSDESDETKTTAEVVAPAPVTDEDKAKEAKAKADADEAARVAAMTPEQKAEKDTTDAAAAKLKKEGDEATARLQAKADAEAGAQKKVDDEAAAKEAAKETPEQKTAREAFEVSIKPYEPTAEEHKALEVFKKEFPESAAAVETRLKSMDREMNARVYQSVQAILSHVHGRLEPVEKTTDELNRQAHFDAIHSVHPDYDVVVEKLPAWIAKQPVSEQPKFTQAYEKGDTQSVLDLFAAYKASPGTAASGKTPQQLAAEQKTADETAAKAKKASEDAAALAPVTSKRTSVTPKGAPDPNDFDAAFEEASNALAVTGKR